MRILVFVSCFYGFLGYSCNSSKAPGACPPPLGRYTNTTVLDKCPEAMPYDIPHFCFELTFNGNDSVAVDNGFEKFSLPIRPAEEGCGYKIRGATLFGDMYFVIDSDSSLQLIDTAWTKVTSFSTFKKIRALDGRQQKFEYYLNDCLVAEEYALFKEGNLVPHTVILLPNGQVTGLKPYIGYSICYAGDCLEETEPAAKTITFLDDKGNNETFVFKTVEGKMAIELYRIAPPIPDMKGGRSIGPMVYELRTE